jgi:hypothetical protein
MVEKTGIPDKTYRRLENGPNHPVKEERASKDIRLWVNCASALHVELADVVEDGWLGWNELTPGVGAPPKPDWWRGRKPLKPRRSDAN